jgi:ribosomal protein S18 acetylase RimI-like enzyme
MQRPDDLGVVAEKEGVPIGAAWLRRWSGQQRGYGFVDKATPELSMSVLPAHRGRGVGTTMLRRLLSAAEERYAAVSLSVAASNPARRLYEREGFVPIDRSENWSENGSITMMNVFQQRDAV